MPVVLNALNDENIFFWKKNFNGTLSRLYFWNFLRGLQCRVSDFFNRYSILLIQLRWFRIFFPNHSTVIRSRASILPMISGDFLSKKRETGTKWGLSIYFIYFCPGMGKDPHYLYLQGWWLYNPAQQVIFSLSWIKTIVLRLKSHSCKNPPLWHMTDSRKTSGNIILYRFSYRFSRFR